MIPELIRCHRRLTTTQCDGKYLTIVRFECQKSLPPGISHINFGILLKKAPIQNKLCYDIEVIDEQERKSAGVRVNIEMQQQLTEPYAVIYTDQVNEEISELVNIISKSGQKENILLFEQGEKYIVVKPEDIYMVRYENGQVMLYGGVEKYTSRQRLYQVEEQLGKDFIRISKTTIIHAKYMESIEPSFNGTMVLKLRNGMKDYISRKYLQDFKKYIGL